MESACQYGLCQTLTTTLSRHTPHNVSEASATITRDNTWCISVGFVTYRKLYGILCNVLTLNYHGEDDDFYKCR